VAALRRAAGLLDVGQTERLVHDLQRGGELRLTGEDRWTTRRMWEQEQHVLAWHGARTGMAEHRPATSAAQLLRTLTKHSPAAGKASRLSVEQLEVLRQMLSQRTTAVRGWAGTGKGTVASAAGEVWRSENRRVMAVAVAGKKAVDLASDLGEGTGHLTVSQFLARSESGRLSLRDTDVIVLDEASMVSTDQWAALATAIGTTATVVLLGDDAQLPAINAGGLWPLLARGGPELTEVHRTRSVWEREATTDLRHGRSTTAFTAYAAHNRVRLARTRAESLEGAVHDWARDGHTGLLITDATNAERDWLNCEAQRHRLLAGELSADAVTVPREGSSLALHAGDRVIFGATYWPGGGGRVENGTTAIVETVDPEHGTVTVQTSEPARREITLPAAAAPLALHYAVHVYKAQGDTVDRAYVITGGWQTSKESLYVACTRARDATRLYLDKETLARDIDAEAIAEAAARGGKSRAKVAATPHPQDSGTTDDRYAKAAARLRRVQRRRKLRRQRADRRPFTERYRLRKKRQDELFEGRLRRQGEEMRRRWQEEVPRPTLDSIAAIQGVPVWALETAEIVTGRSYVAEHVFHQATGRSLGI
jgi:ATP-dependent exoDNAse (exonuclease V) alpha subunit